MYSLVTGRKSREEICDLLTLGNSGVVLVAVPNGTSKKSLEEMCDLLTLRNSRVVLVVVPNVGSL